VYYSVGGGFIVREGEPPANGTFPFRASSIFEWKRIV
jgi:hypothetical protein